MGQQKCPCLSARSGRAHRCPHLATVASGGMRIMAGRSRAYGAAWLGLFVITVFAVPVPRAAAQQPPAANDNKSVTFTKDIAPILQRSCQQCHRPDSLAPMSLMTYEEARPYARAMKAKTALRGRQGVMPPWH